MTPIEYFRKRLNERKLVFLLGAGASCEAKLPLMSDLTEAIGRRLSAPSRRMFEALSRLVRKERRAAANIEDLLNAALLLEQQHESTVLPLPEPFTPDRLTRFRREATMLIRSELQKVTHSDYHREFVGRLFAKRSYPDPIWFYTTNNDILLEDALDYNRIAFGNGFSGLYRRHLDERTLDPVANRKPAYLVKLHGSITYASEGGQIIEDGSLARTDNEAALIVYPSRDKYAESHKSPYALFQAKFRETLRSCQTLVVIGYSFSDAHLNEPIYEAVRTNPQLTAFAFLKEARPDLEREAARLERLSLFTERTLEPDYGDCWKASRLFKFIAGGAEDEQGIA